MPGLEDLYREIILDHYRTPRNRGELETPPAIESNGHNPLCGDEITRVPAARVDGERRRRTIVSRHQDRRPGLLDLAVVGIDDEPGGEGQVGRRGQGAHPTLQDDDVDRRLRTQPGDADIALGDLEALQGVVKFPVRIKCAVLGWNTLADALDHADD